MKPVPCNLSQAGVGEALSLTIGHAPLRCEILYSILRDQERLRKL